MTTYYIDPDAAGGGNGLTELTAFDSWADVTAVLGDDNSYLMKRGTEENLVAFVNVNQNADNTLFGRYSTGAPPIIRKYQTSSDTGDWSELEGNIWEFDTGVDSTSFNALVVLGVGSLGAWTRRRDTQDATGNGVDAFAVAGEWDGIAGDGGALNAAIRIYSTAGNPVTVWGAIYWDQQSLPGMRLRSLSGTSVDGLKFENSWRGLMVAAWDSIASTAEFKNGQTHQCYNGAVLTSNLGGTLGDASVHDCAITESGNIGIDTIEVQAAQPVVRTSIYRNLVKDSGMSVSNSGIHFGAVTGGAGAENLIYDNVIEGVSYGYFWPLDGGGIFLDSTASYYQVFRNKVSVENVTGGAAYKVNSGLAGTQKWYCNVSEGISEGFRHGDTAADAAADLVLYNNTFAGCLDAGIFLNAAGVSSYMVKNCIMTGDNSASSVGISVTAGAAAALTSGESNNCVYNFETDDTNFTIDATSFTTDPQLISATDLRLEASSPCVGAGTKWWALGSQPLGQDGLRFPLRAGQPDIGAYAVRPGEDGATRKAYALPASVLEAGVDIAKAKAA